MKSVFTILISLISFSAFTQTLEELNALKAEKEAILAERNAVVAEIQAEVDGINAQIKALPGWEKGFTGIVGFDFSGNNDWYAISNPNSRSNGIGLNIATFANYDQPKYFWNNQLTINLSRVVSQIDKDSDGIEAISDALDFSSLFGYKLSSKLAVSAEAKFTSTIFNFNDPGKLVAGLGISWLPIAGMSVNILPLSYEKNWPGELISATGAKLGINYGGKLGKSISWSSNFSSFIPYTGGTISLSGPVNSEDVEFSSGEVFNWTWINGFSTKLWKKIGVGFNIGLRQDRQIAEKAFYGINDARIDGNPIQMYYTLGLSYTL